MVTVERMTAGALARGGIVGGRLTLLVHDALMGRARPRRALERAVGGEMTVVMPHDDAPCPLEFPNRRRRYDGIVVASVDLGRGMRWEDDTLYGHLPDTLASAVIGRPLGDVLGHPDIDPAVMTVAPRHAGGIVSVERMVMPLAGPTLRDRITHPWYRMRLLAHEGRMDAPAPTRMLVMQAIVTTLVAAVLTMQLTREAQTTASTILACGLGLAVAQGIWNVTNMSRRKPFSMLKAMVVGTRHADDLANIRMERKK